MKTRIGLAAFFAFAGLLACLCFRFPSVMWGAFHYGGVLVAALWLAGMGVAFVAALLRGVRNRRKFYGR